jgi:hypothetical protein
MAQVKQDNVFSTASALGQKFLRVFSTATQWLIVARGETLGEGTHDVHRALKERVMRCPFRAENSETGSHPRVALWAHMTCSVGAKNTPKNFCPRALVAPRGFNEMELEDYNEKHHSTHNTCHDPAPATNGRR